MTLSLIYQVCILPKPLLITSTTPQRTLVGIMANRSTTGCIRQLPRPRTRSSHPCEALLISFPIHSLGNRSISHPRGKVVGGSSALNFLIFNRASKPEYDAWKEFGNQGWGWDGLLDSFKASTNYTRPTDAQMFPGAGSAANASSKEKVRSRGFPVDLILTVDAAILRNNRRNRCTIPLHSPLALQLTGVIRSLITHSTQTYSDLMCELWRLLACH